MRRHDKITNRERAYMATLSAAERKAHLAARRYPSGRYSHGGANRSANIKREVRLRVTTITLCQVCGGVTPEIAALTSLFPPCLCT